MYLQRVTWCEQEGLLCRGYRLAEVQGVLFTVPDHSSPLPMFREGPQRPGFHRNGACVLMQQVVLSPTGTTCGMTVGTVQMGYLRAAGHAGTLKKTLANDRDN